MAKLEVPAPLVSAAWLHEQLGHEDLIIFDASWHMPATGRDGFGEWQQEHIRGARFFDFDGKTLTLSQENYLPKKFDSRRILKAQTIC